MRTKRLLLRFRRISNNIIYFSNGEFKHSNNKVLINIYLYNKQKNSYLFKLKKRYLKKILQKNNELNKKLIKRLNNINIKLSDMIRKDDFKRYLFLSAMAEKYGIKKQDSSIIGITDLGMGESVDKMLSDQSIVFYKLILKKSLRKLRMFYLYKQLIYINKSKYNYTYLRLIKKILENLFKKNVEFNLVNLSRFYLNSDIFTESLKLKITRNKRKLKKILKKIQDKVELSKKKISLLDTKPNGLSKPFSNKTDETLIKESLKYKDVTGFRLELKGRLTKRYTASRSLSFLKYKGNLLNVDSSIKSLSTVMLKGNQKSNIQYTKVCSKSRIGSFGVKG